MCPYSRINSVHSKPTKIWVICGGSNHHHPHRTVSHRVFHSVFQQLLLWIQAQFLLQPQAPHSLRISRGRTRSLTILQIQVSLMSKFYLVRFKLSDTTTPNKFSRCQDTQSLGNSSSMRSTKNRRQEDSLMDFFDLQQLI